MRLSHWLIIFSFVSIPYTQAAPISDGTTQDKIESKCYNFRENQWRFQSNQPNLPTLVKKREMLLIPDNMFNTGVAMIINSDIKPPFEASFRYSTWDDDGSVKARANSADGFTFFFLKDASDLGTPPDGDSLGLKTPGGGYAVRFRLYKTRAVQLTNPEQTVLGSTWFDRVYSNRQWVPVKVKVTDERITVTADNHVILDAPTKIDDTYSDMGFTAASGDADAEQAIKNFCIRSLL